MSVTAQIKEQFLSYADLQAEAKRNLELESQNPITRGFLRYFNFCLATDSYKHAHWKMYPQGTEKVVLYGEHRSFKYFDKIPQGKTVSVGLTPIIENYLAGVVVTAEMVEEARTELLEHFGNDDVFNYDGFMIIVNEYGGMLPISIRAVDEGQLAI